MAMQQGILLPVPRAARYLEFALRRGAAAAGCLRAARSAIDGESVVAGIGAPLARALGRAIPGLHPFPRVARAKVALPATPRALWLWLRGSEPGELFCVARELERALEPAFRRVEAVDAFRHREGRDLTGYEDGTENPKGAAARRAAIVGDGPLAGSSFVAVQRWTHRFERFERMAPRRRDLAIGRRLRDNEEIASAPASAHVKRTEQESFDPPAFVLRRSMPWIRGADGGLMFVAFGSSLEPFALQLRRMAGAEDGVVDALFGFSRPVSGATYWCPALIRGRLDLRPLGIR